MKIFFKFFIIILLALFSQNNAFWYELDFSWKGFYSNISNNLSDINWKMYSIELQNNWWTREKIAELSWLNCLDRDLSENEIKDIVENENIWFLIKNLNWNCKNWTEIDSNALNKIIWAIKTLSNNSKIISKSKTNKAISFSNIWIYSDWIESNWPFDLMNDFEEIDKIIFIQNKTKNDYKEWEEINLSEKIKKLFNKVNKNSWNWNNKNSWNWNSWIDYNNKNSSNNLWICSLDWNCDNYTEVQKLLCEVNWNCSSEEKRWFLTLKNEHSCKIDSSSLNLTTGKIISATLDWKSWKNSWENSQNWLNWDSLTKNNSSNNWPWVYTELKNPSWWYDKKNDNKQFPCNDFFCIKINFKTYNHDLTWNSIEFLINRSNKHLKNFVNSSLSQWKMTNNNFEIWLKDVNLPEMFHLGIQISQQPVPILKLDKTEKDSEDKWETKLDSQLEKYYKAHGLNYKLRNDLSAFLNTDQENQAWINWSSTIVTEVWNKLEQMREKNIENLEEIDSMRKTIEDKVRFWRVSDIEMQMKEIEKFNSAINIYIVNLEAILKEIKKIPLDKTKS